MDSFHVSDVAEEIPANEESIEALRTDAVSLEVMSFEPGDEDPMHAHGEDEIYHVDAGSATINVETWRSPPETSSTWSREPNTSSSTSKTSW